MEWILGPLDLAHALIGWVIIVVLVGVEVLVMHVNMMRRISKRIQKIELELLRLPRRAND